MMLCRLGCASCHVCFIKRQAAVWVPVARCAATRGIAMHDVKGAFVDGNKLHSRKQGF